MGARSDVASGEYAAPDGIHDRSGALHPEVEPGGAARDVDGPRPRSPPRDHPRREGAARGAQRRDELRAGGDEPDDQRARRDARRRHAHAAHPRRRRADDPRDLRLRPRDPSRDPRADLRAVFQQQRGGPGPGHRARPGDRSRDREALQGHDRGPRQRAARHDHAADVARGAAAAASRTASTRWRAL